MSMLTIDKRFDSYGQEVLKEKSNCRMEVKSDDVRLEHP